MDNYADKLKILHGKPSNLVNLDPFQMSDEDWIDDISQWLPVEFGQIYTHLINIPGQFTRGKNEGIQEFGNIQLLHKVCMAIIIKA